jgi:4-amino-4-deoxy-L-arabinose transferase-like glycosyltransferase
MKRWSSDTWIAIALGAGAFLLLFATERAVGFVRDESVYFVAGEQYAHWLSLLLEHPSQALEDGSISHAFEFNREHPVLFKTLFGLSQAFFNGTLNWMRPASAARIPALLIASLIPSVLYLWGRRLFSRTAGLFAAFSFFAVPRQFFHAHLACFDMPIAAMWLVTVYAFARARDDRRWGWACGVLFGLSLATKHNAFFMPVVLVPFAAASVWIQVRSLPLARTRVLQLFSAVIAWAILWAALLIIQGPVAFVQNFQLLSPGTAIAVLGIGVGAWLLRRLREASPEAEQALLPIAAMTVLGPLILYLHWPFLWHHPIERIAWYLEFHATHNHYAWMYLGTLLREPPFPLEYVFAVTALTVPISLSMPMVLGAGQVVRDAIQTRRWPSWEIVLIGVNALTSILLISLPDVPHFGGVKHWLPSMPFLALFAGLAVDRAALSLQAWSRRPAPYAAPVLGSFLLLPAILDTAHVHPYGTSAYSELAGGIPGAASLGMQRQYWSNNVSGVLDWINAHAPRGSRLWLHEVNGFSFRDYQRNGMLREDLRPANGPADAHLAAYQYHQEFREQELEIWNAFGTQIPVTGLYLDGTPQIVVYVRPGVMTQ